MDLGDLWRGRLSMRRCLVLVRGLPPGAGLHRARGGDMAWSPVERAVREGAWQVVCAVMGVAGMFSKRPVTPPARPEPPEVGWWEKRRAAEERVRRKVARMRGHTSG